MPFLGSPTSGLEGVAALASVRRRRSSSSVQALDFIIWKNLAKRLQTSAKFKKCINGDTIRLSGMLATVFSVLIEDLLKGETYHQRKKQMKEIQKFLSARSSARRWHLAHYSICHLSSKRCHKSKDRIR